MEPSSQAKALALANSLQTLDSSQLAHPTTTSDANAADHRGNRPLHLLFSNRHDHKKEDLASLVRILLENGADLESRNDEGTTPLHAAVARGSMEAVEVLLKSGADAKSRDNQGSGLLHYLAGSRTNARSCSDLLQLLLNIGCDINARSHYGRTPLYIAICTGHIVCFDLLLERGANVRYRDVTFDTTVLHIAAKFDKDCFVDRLMRMLSRADDCEKDVLINARQRDGRTALHLAARHKLTFTLSLLLRNGADVESVDSFGRTALHYACLYENADAFEALMDSGADINALDNRGFTPMNMNDQVEAAIWLKVVTRNAKSMAAGLPVVDFRKNLVHAMMEVEGYKNHLVEQMKKTMINSKVSVYDLLLDEDKMYKYRYNVVLKEIVMSGESFLRIREILIGKYRKAGFRRNLVRLASKALCKMTGFRLEELNDKIFQKLSNAELHGVVEAAVRGDEDWSVED